MRSPGKTMVLMRGLPSCGKSHTSRTLVAAGGVRFEFDEYFYSQVGEHSNVYNWSRDLMPHARRWNLDRIVAAVDEGVSPIIIDSDNNVCTLTKRYVTHAIERGYDIRFKEPESPWWQTIRSLLKDRKANKQALCQWANRLAMMNRKTHRVPLNDFLRRMERWEDVTLESILAAA